LVLQFRRLIGLEAQSANDSVWFGLLIVMLYGLVCAVFALRQAFASEFTLPDDGREHVFWMFRFMDPRLFPGDPMADYFQSLGPPGYVRLYWLLAQIRIDPLLASKLIPAALSFVATGYFFGFARRFFCAETVATFATILFTQCLWLNSDLSSATPRAFFYPLFAAFLYYQQRDAFAGILLSVILAALFFPPAALLILAVLGFIRLSANGPLFASSRVRNYILLGAALIVSLLCLLPYLAQASACGPIVTVEQAARMPEFGPEGRIPVFFSSWWGRWVAGNGGIHTPPTRPPWLLAAFLWPLVRKFPRHFQLLNPITRGARPIPQVIAGSLALFCIAHLLLFQLYLPNRYTAPVMRVLLPLLSGGVLLALIDAALSWGATYLPTRMRRLREATIVGSCAGLLGVIVCYPLFRSKFPTADYIRGVDRGLYQFFSRQPIETRIASLSDEVDNLPMFSHRSIVFGAECAVSFHPNYYLPLRERGLQIARAQYAADSSFVEKVVREQRINFWLLDSKAFSSTYWRKSRSLKQLRLAFPAENLGLHPETTPFLQRAPTESIAYRNKHFTVIDTHRLFP
jgi:hypothetical protein